MKIKLILMAAGNSRRFGSNKLLYEWKGRPMYSYGLDALAGAARELEQRNGLLECRVAVVSQYREILESGLGRQNARERIWSPDSRRGVSYTIRAALKEGEPADWYLFCAADQPRLTAGTVASLVQETLKSGKGIGCVRSGEHRGNPVLFHCRYGAELCALEGDMGGRSVIKAHPEDLFELEAPADELFDVDMPF